MTSSLLVEHRIWEAFDGSKMVVEQTTQNKETATHASQFAYFLFFHVTVQKSSTCYCCIGDTVPAPVYLYTQ